MKKSGPVPLDLFISGLTPSVAMQTRSLEITWVSLSLLVPQIHPIQNLALCI
jgi:hypothetical protein